MGIVSKTVFVTILNTTFALLFQLDPGQDEGVDGTDGVEEKDEVEQRVPHTTTAPESPCAPVAKNKYPVVLPYVKGVSE